MKYCEDDVAKARKRIEYIDTANKMIKMCIDCVKFTDEEKILAYKAYDITKNIVRYGNKLDDDKLNKLLRMKTIIGEDCK